MRAGKLRHRIEIQKPISGDVGEAGNPDITWQTEGLPVWGSIDPVTVGKRLSSQQVESVATHVVTIRHHKAIAQNWRFKFGTRIFNIASIVAPDMRPIEMQILVKEEV